MRMVFMAYVSGSIEAVDFYCRAFEATSNHCYKANDDDDFYAHAEIVINDHVVLAISDTSNYPTDFQRQNNMQFWLTFDNEKSLDAAYNTLKEKAQIHYPLAPIEWTSKMADLTDAYGIRWLLNYNR